MPTGYTADLEARNYDVKSWLKENVIRGMGVCIALRDHGKMTVEEIIGALKKDESESYHANKLKEAQQALTDFKSLNAAQLFQQYEKELAEAEKKYVERCKKFNEKKTLHLKATAETTALYNKAVEEKQGEVIVNTLRFALDQLNQAFSFDYRSGPYREDILDQTFDEWNIAKRKKLLWDIEYHGRELPKEENRNFDRLNEYKNFVEWVDSTQTEGAR